MALSTRCATQGPDAHGGPLGKRDPRMRPALGTREQTVRDDGPGLTLDLALSRSYPALQQMMYSEDVKEGPKAFAEKRKPNWKGK